ncbi:MAG TPA: hypothetical protein VK049_07460 [Paenalcaligenes sp.]|nr:hypothetical protein [Paenalcaligenes sp.]
MGHLSFDALSPFLERQEGPCLSLYQATHRSHPDNAQDPIRFKNLVKELEQSLSSKYHKNEYEPLLEPFHRLAADEHFWQHTLDGLAILAKKDEFQVFSLQRPTPDFAVVSDSFHIKPLLRQMQTLDRFQVICLTRQAVQLFEGNRDVMDHILLDDEFPSTIEQALGEEREAGTLSIASYRLGAAARTSAAMFHGHGGRAEAVEVDTERFFRVVDRAINDRITKRSNLPLVLVTLPEYQGIFRKLSHNSHLLKEGISIDPTALSVDDLRQRVWQVVEPVAQERVANAVAQFKKSHGTGLASDNIQSVVRAILDGRVDTLLISAEQRIPGRINRQEKKVDILEDFNAPDVEDVLDDLAEMAFRRSGKLMVLPEEVMPTDTGIAAIYRY